ncbi:hypothetical protein ACH4TV_44645 [Streptomyces sp. NPDC020898]|uniref:hypothetical protein n=1 Tax=Streptomyces sp. NPDC020898 TaxID=3365101 RepID=UPI0037B47DAE
MAGKRDGSWVVPGLLNLLLGLPAMIPLYLGWWLLTEYLPMDCHSVADAARSTGGDCNYTTLDHAGPVMFLLALSGLFVVCLVLLVDVLLPRRRGARPGPWLGTALLIPVPFVVALVLART